MAKTLSKSKKIILTQKIPPKYNDEFKHGIIATHIETNEILTKNKALIEIGKNSKGFIKILLFIYSLTPLIFQKKSYELIARNRQKISLLFNSRSTLN